MKFHESPRKPYLCLMCGSNVAEAEIAWHKRYHASAYGYGIMWPSGEMNSSGVCGTLTPVYESAVIARKIGVRKVYIRDEGNNPSGSMKDYLVSRAVALGLQKGFKRFAVVSSGNHAVSLAMETQRCGASAIVFTPGSSGKLPLLTSFTNTLVIGIRGAIFEDVYNLVSGLSIEGVYDANVCNEDLLPALMPVARDLLTLNPPPTHVLAGVGNGTYLAGIALGLEKIGSKSTPKIVAVGMKGAFPTEEAFRRKRMLHKYKEFLTEESEISAAEGSIATESYSMPQLLHALRISKGFTLGELTNQDLGDAYRLLLEDQELFSRGVIPEATGIMSLAAALRWQNMFSPEDVLHLSFTGHGAKDTEAIRRLLPAAMCGLVEEAASRARPDLVECATRSGRRGAILVDRDVSIEAISEIIAKRGRDD